MEHEELRKIIKEVIIESRIFEEAPDNTEIFDEERIVNDEAKNHTKLKKPFIGSHIFAEWLGNQVYAVISYNRNNPIFIWKNGKWYENKDNYIYNNEPTNSEEHKKNSRPTINTFLKTSTEMKSMLEDAMREAGIKELSHTEVFPGTKN